MWQRGALWKTTLVGGLLLAAFLAMPSSSFPRARDYSALVELLQTQQERETPLYAFNPFEESLDEAANSSGIQFFNEHPKLLNKIRNDLGPGEIEWKIEHSRHRLLFVPEQREEMGRLFEDYCGDVIDYTLRKTKLENPYVKIVTLEEETPEIPAEGVTAYLVHNLVEEVKGTFVFSNPGRKSLKIDLSRKTFLGEVGSYTTNIFFHGNGEPEFSWDRYTIWQTTARNAFTVLSVPVEETLHIAVREHTHQAILEEFAESDPASAEVLEKIVEDWMAVEEAVVGGVLHALLPPFLKSHAKNLPDSLIAQDVESRGRFEKYQYLKKAIGVVGELGYEEAIRMYADHPQEFRELVM